MAKDYVEHVRRDLLFRVGQFVECLVDFCRNDVVLDRNRDFYENIVLGLGFDIQSQLLNPQIDAAGNLVQPGKLEIHTRIGDAQKLAHALDDHSLGGSHLEKAAEYRAQQKYADDSVKDEQ